MAEKRAYLRTSGERWVALSCHFGDKVMQVDRFPRRDGNGEDVLVKLRGGMSKSEKSQLIADVEGAWYDTRFFKGYNSWHQALKTAKERTSSLELG